MERINIKEERKKILNEIRKKIEQATTVAQLKLLILELINLIS